MAAPRRRNFGLRRRVEDEAEDEAGPEGLELDDDSLTDGSLGTEDPDPADNSDTSNIDEASPTSPKLRKSTNGAAKISARRQSITKRNLTLENKANVDTDMMLHGLPTTGPLTLAREINFDEVATTTGTAPSSALAPAPAPAPAKSPSAPVIVSSASALRPPPESIDNRRRTEHEDYKKRRDEDPAFVPNRGSFFMHDHRHAGPAANGFRPFGRGRGRGGRGGIGGPFSPIKFVTPIQVKAWPVTDRPSQISRPGDSATNSQWTHDMHETVVEPVPRRPRYMPDEEGPPNGNGFIPTRESNSFPINRTLSCEKHIGNAQIRVFLPNMKAPIVKPGVPVKQYTKLPDHRPPLRRDKPVRISLPNRPPRYIYPAADRSFIFIPRAMRPNQQRARGKARSGLGSTGGFSRRTSVFGGSYYNGSIYSPSVALSRRSSFAQDRDMFSPAASVMSRPAVPVENSRPVVRLPPVPRPEISASGPLDGTSQYGRPVAPETTINDLPQPQTHPLPQKPSFQENRQVDLPMHQPRPQKNISVADIETPNFNQGSHAFQQAFHQQVPMQVPNGYSKDPHSRHLSHHSTGTPLSQIPERAIHAAPFQPNVFGQQTYFNQQPYQPQTQQDFYYPQSYPGPNMVPAAANPAFVPPDQQGPPGAFPPQNQPEQTISQGLSGANLVAQEANGMVYYYDPAQLAPPVNTYQQYPTPPSFQPGVMGMGGMVTPSPDGYYYPQTAPGMVYYPQ